MLTKKEFAEITSSTGPEYKPRLRLQAQLGSGPTVPTEAGDSMPHKTKCAHKRQLFLKHFHMRSAAAQDHSVQHFCVELYTSGSVGRAGPQTIATSHQPLKGLQDNNSEYYSHK